MKLLTKGITDKLPPLYSQESEADPMVVAKFFDPMGSWTWFVIEGEPQGDGDFLFFGLVDGFETELGYFALSELESVGKTRILGIERDIHFEPVCLSEVQSKLVRR